MQRSCRAQPEGIHAAIIMDGNGRWARRRKLPRVAGHQEGAAAVRRIVEAAPAAGITTLTLFAFSADNWQRPGREVAWLMRLFRDYLRTETARCIEQGVRLSVIGRRDRLARRLVREVERAEGATAAGQRLHLRVAVDYSARDAILRAAQCLTPDTAPTREAFGRLISIVDHGGPSAPPVDLLIRTGGEQRLSDFMLWECAYAELLFVPTMWPDFTADDLHRAVGVFQTRERRFGRVTASVAAPPEPVRLAGNPGGPYVVR